MPALKVAPPWSGVKTKTKTNPKKKTMTNTKTCSASCPPCSGVTLSSHSTIAATCKEFWVLSKFFGYYQPTEQDKRKKISMTFFKKTDKLTQSSNQSPEKGKMMSKIQTWSSVSSPLPSSQASSMPALIKGRPAWDKKFIEHRKKFSGSAEMQNWDPMQHSRI